MTSSFQTFKIDELQLGMYVHQIAEQKHDVSIKAQGLLLKEETIAGLKEKGVSKVVVDLSKSQHEIAPIKQVQESETAKVLAKTSFENEIAKASRLHDEGKRIQQTLLDLIQENALLGKHVPKDFSKDIVDSIYRNPNALLCMTKIREKDEYLIEHSLNVSILLAHFGREFGMDRADIDELAYAGFLHDLGKIKVPDNILHKPGQLTDDEMEIMKLHVTYGAETLQDIGVDSGIVQTVCEHHERLDGKGYPAGKPDNEISLHGRMIAIVDVYDALTADRVYKAGMSSQKALKIILEGCPHKYDEYLVNLFIKCVGIFPVGSLVLLSNQRIAFVLQQNEGNPTKPRVRVFYSANHRHYLESKDINLATERNVEVVKPVMPREYGIDVKALFERSIKQ
ncbi:HD-GYP domain-containing protein [Alteromonas sediminis]|uniref:HD-GYP domain-containing protein n=1 Tax=Alteromonas sediminis TaxID=2259342 RepID=A0A3N5Y9T9_9ALTE|nr:HD-GYP domain-containing protein [Alteromonas sediminis]RPJ68119.1 HD-GYP domain-containing protein [Alteromonas sediminis]